MKNAKALKFSPFLASLLIIPTGAVGQNDDRSPRWIDLLDLQLGEFESDPKLAGINSEIGEIAEYVSARLGVDNAAVRTKIAVQFLPPEADPSLATDPNRCPLRGLAMSSKNSHTIMIFIDDETLRDQVLGVFAHELGHIIQWTGIEGGKSIAGMFNEGFPTWAAGDYWLRWQGVRSWRAAVRSLIEGDSYIPLSAPSEGADSGSGDRPDDCLERRSTRYTQWAALINYLVETYGQEQLFALFRQTVDENSNLDTGAGFPLPRRLSPNFSGIYGKPLSDLESEWLSEVGVNKL